MAGESLFRIAGIAVIVLITLFTLFKDDRYRVAWLAFIGAFDYFAIKMGVVWEPGKIVGFGLLILVLFHWKRYSAPLKSSGLKLLAPFFVYVVLMTLYQAQSWPQSEYLPDSFLYNEGRFLVQFSRIIIGVAAALVVWRACVSEGNIRFIVRAVVLSCGFLAAYGLYQVLAPQYGLPMTGITRGGGIDVSTNVRTVIGREYIGRAYSFAGEPKGLAAILSLGILLLISLPHKYLFPAWGVRLGVPLLGLMFAAFLLTFSSAGYIMFLLGTVSVPVLLIYFRYPAHFAKVVAFAPVLAIVGSLLLTSVAGVRLGEVAEERVSKRVQSESALTYADKGIIQTWKDRPDLLVLGAGLGGSSFYVRQYSDAYAGFTAAPRGLLGRIGDAGLIGFALWITSVSVLFLRCMKYRHVSPRTDSLAVLVLCGYGILMVFTIATWFIEWLLYGIMAGIASVYARRASLSKSQQKMFEGVIVTARS